ncbi:TRAP transporter large permease [Pseudooceanicola aestuarii]|uniref:TRAP transporter large permease n=1 Tax=Pseudooceanicola aestuarii TaxID=2697319 RepID=UPI0013D17875|nr:TRAP transporter large permease [Pseudooceanicola aestuarii]
MDVVLLFGMVVGLLLIGVPIAISLGLSSILFLLMFSDTSLASIAQSFYQAMAGHYTLLAIPFFILASSFMSTGGVAQRIIRFSIALVGHLPGGLAIAGVVACMMFAALSGSSPATVVAIGTIVIAGMQQVGYSKDFAAGVIANAGTLGILIPPSIVMVVYASATDVSVGRMFLAGVIPGLVAGGMLMATIYGIAKLRNLPKGDWLGWGEVMDSMLEAGWGLFLIVIILVGIYGGIFTPTEAAAVASVYAFLVAIFIYRDMGPLSRRKWLPEGREATDLLGFRVVGFSLVNAILWQMIAVVSDALDAGDAALIGVVFIAVAIVAGALMSLAARRGILRGMATGLFAVMGVLPWLWFMASAVMGQGVGLWPGLAMAVAGLVVCCLPPAVFLFALSRGAQGLAGVGGSYATSLARGAGLVVKGNVENVIWAIPSLFSRATRDTLFEAGKLTITLMFIIANALILKHVLTDEQIPQQIASAMLAAGFGPIMFLVIVNVILLIGGQFMEPSGLIVIVAPLVFPIAIQLGIDPIHLGIIMVVNMEIGMITPPVGLNLFVTSGVAGMPMMRVVRAALPFLAVLFVFLILVTYVPAISTWLPILMMGPEIITN